MNIDRMLELADRIEGLERKEHDDQRAGFNMAYYSYGPEVNCKTACCIAGWTVALFASKEQRRWSAPSAVHRSARELLDLDAHQAFDLFSFAGQRYIARVTPERAARALRRMTKGKAPWIFRSNSR